MSEPVRSRFYALNPPGPAETKQQMAPRRNGDYHSWDEALALADIGANSDVLDIIHFLPEWMVF